MKTALEEVNGLGDLVSKDAGSAWLSLMPRFESYFANYREFQIVPETGDLCLLTFSSGVSYLNAIEEVLQDSCFSRQHRDVFASLRRFIPEATWGVKFPVRDIREVHMYARKRLPVEEVLFWLQQQQPVPDNVAGSIRRLAEILGKKKIHFLCADAVAGQSVRYHIYFTQYLEHPATIGPRLVDAAGALDMPNEFIDQINRYFTLLAQPHTTLWVSLGIEGDRLFESFKLDFSDVRLGSIAVTLEDIGLDTDRCDLPIQAGRLLELDKANYFGVRMLKDRPPLVSIYFTKRGGEEAEADPPRQIGISQ